MGVVSQTSLLVAVAEITSLCIAEQYWKYDIDLIYGSFTVLE